MERGGGGTTGFDTPSLMLFLLSDAMGYFALLRVDHEKVRKLWIGIMES
jgi:hypothetical protein